jgi:hypothetical protein
MESGRGSPAAAPTSAAMIAARSGGRERDRIRSGCVCRAYHKGGRGLPMVGVALRRIGMRVASSLWVGEANSPESPIWGLEDGVPAVLNPGIDHPHHDPIRAVPPAERFRLSGRLGRHGRSSNPMPITKLLIPRAEGTSVEARCKGAGTLFLAILLVACGCCFGEKADQPPNILMIAVDDMNDWVGCHGDESCGHHSEH